MEQGSVGIALLLTLIAGLSTGIGSLIAIFTKRTNKNFLSLALGFSAGVMIYVSFMEMIPRAEELLIHEFREKGGYLYLILSFFGGMALIALIDFLVPSTENPHEIRGVEEMNKNRSLRRTGLLVALTIGIHNFPEGVATFMSGLTSLEIAIPIAFAIAIHNIPEGIAVSVPIYQATGSRKKAFWLSFSSGFAEPMGALIAYLFLMPFWSPFLNAVILASVAGIMVYISLDELLPSAEKYGKHHHSIIGLVLGMIAMAISLYLFI